MNERTLRIRLGLFVLVALILLGVLIVLFGSSTTLTWFQSTAKYTIEFDEATGVASGTPVRLAGVRIGDVSDVRLARINDRDVVLVDVAVERKFKIRHDQIPTLSSSLIGGDAVIDFVIQKKAPDTTPWPEGSTIKGQVAATVGSLVTRASEVVPNTQELMNDIRKSLQNLEKLTPSAEATMKEYRELAREARTAMPDVQKAAVEVRKLATTLNEAAPDAKDATKQLDQLIKSLNQAFPDFRKTNEQLQKFVASLNDAMPEFLKTNKNVQDLAKQASAVIPDVRTSVRDVGAAAQQYNKLGESLDKLVRDNQVKVGRIVDNTNAALDRVLDLLSNENRRNVADTLRNLRMSSDTLPETSKNLNDTLKEAKESAKRLRSTMDKADESLASIRDLTKMLNEKLPALVTNAGDAFDKLNRILGDVKELVRVIGESDGTFKRFITDPGLYNHIDEAVCMVGKTIPRIDRILKDVETFADKLARHPELIGVSGAVRPSTGLKDPPAPYPGHVVP